METHMKLRDWINKDKITKEIYINPIAPHLFNSDNKDIFWSYLSQNENPKALQLLEQHQDKINWEYLAINPNGLSLLEQNPQHIHWNLLSLNKEDTKQIKIS